MPYQLVVLKGRSAAQRIPLMEEVTTLGRQDGCELTVRSSQVSRRHCQLFEKKGLLLVKDLGSSNGTFVNEEKVEDQRVLEPGDILSLGPIQFRVESAEAPEVAGASEESPKPGDTAVPVAVDAPIPLDDDDVLDFVTGDDEQPTQAPAEPKAAKEKGKSPSKESPAPKSGSGSGSGSGGESEKSRPKPPASKSPPEEKPEESPEGLDDAVADFLTDIKLDDED